MIREWLKGAALAAAAFSNLPYWPEEEVRAEKAQAKAKSERPAQAPGFVTPLAAD
ncbi:hypothetical protein ACSHT0_10645 [Tepidicaulis sp. LMO-SS28]|uniref:hypothetical protein n=1 Tax=Tepidicaulis sp. LMO-SS28 TaxID=3447455 RepID=UPI003EE2656C